MSTPRVACRRSESAVPWPQAGLSTGRSRSDEMVHEVRWVDRGRRRVTRDGGGAGTGAQPAAATTNRPERLRESAAVACAWAEGLPQSAAAAADCGLSAPTEAASAATAPGFALSLRVMGDG